MVERMTIEKRNKIAAKLQKIYRGDNYKADLFLKQAEKEVYRKLDNERLLKIEA